MQTFKKFLLFHLPILSFFLTTSIARPTSTSFCGKIRIQTPFSIQNPTDSSPLNRMIICKSQKLYFRTTLGLFPVSSIDYTSKILTISHPSCTSSLHYVSPSLLSAGLPSPPQTNSLVLFNCSNQRYPMSPFIYNCTHSYECGASSEHRKQEVGPSSCLLVDNLQKLDVGFHPKEFNCSHYSRVYRNSSNENKPGGYMLGTTISFDIPGHVPDMCNECEKPNGNCGVGLRCICHPKECKDKVISASVIVNCFGDKLFFLLFCIIAVVGFLMQGI